MPAIFRFLGFSSFDVGARITRCGIRAESRGSARLDIYGDDCSRSSFLPTDRPEDPILVPTGCVLLDPSSTRPLRHWNPILDATSARSSTSGTTSPLDTRPAFIVLGFELTDLSRIVLLQAIVPESCRSQASCQCGNA